MAAQSMPGQTDVIDVVEVTGAQFLAVFAAVGREWGFAPFRHGQVPLPTLARHAGLVPGAARCQTWPGIMTAHRAGAVHHSSRSAAAAEPCCRAGGWHVSGAGPGCLAAICVPGPVAGRHSRLVRRPGRGQQPGGQHEGRRRARAPLPG